MFFSYNCWLVISLFVIGLFCCPCEMNYEIYHKSRFSRCNNNDKYYSRLHELTQKIDVFIVVGGPGVTAGNSYSEEDIIMVDKAALAAAAKADDEELERARNARGDTVYQCTVCPASFQVFCFHNESVL